MKTFKQMFLLGLISLLTSVGFAQENPFHFKWDNGFKLNSEDGNFKFKFGGRVMWDNAFFFQDNSLETNFSELKNGSEFRRARFYHSGTVYKYVEYKLQLDFAGGKVTFKDVFIAIKGIPGVGKLTMGHFKEPFRLEVLTSSKYITFMERALPIELMPERNIGFMLSNEFLKERLGYQVGVFRRADGAGNDIMADDGYNITARVAGIPCTNDDQSRLVHLGAGFSFRKPNSNEYEVESRPEAHLGNKYVNTGTIANVSNMILFNAEAALVFGPFSAQGEYAQSNVMRGSGFENYNFNGYYAEVSYFLTGEHRPYKGVNEGFDRVKPDKNLGKGGAGAWQVALRYSSIDLNSDGLQGGKLSDFTAGVNWYLNPVTRIMFNYVLARLKEVGNANIAQMRVQVDF